MYNLSLENSPLKSKFRGLGSPWEKSPSKIPILVYYFPSEKYFTKILHLLKSMSLKIHVRFLESSTLKSTFVSLKIFKKSTNLNPHSLILWKNVQFVLKNPNFVGRTSLRKKSLKMPLFVRNFSLWKIFH